MGERMTCPGCNAHTSDVLHAYRRDEPCPVCGLTSDAAFAVMAARASHADKVLSEKLVEALKRVDELERQNEKMSYQLMLVKDALDWTGHNG